MAHRSKRYREIRESVDRSKRYEIDEAIAALKEQKAARFDESVEVVVKLGVDPKRTDQVVRGSVKLPKGTGKSVSVIVFAEGERAEAARKAGAVEAGGDELIQRIEKGWMGFDVAIASPDMMRKVGKLGRILGPQGKMPSPKSGTVTEDVATAVADFMGGKIEYRTDNTGNVHAPVGKVSFPAEDLRENIQAFFDHLNAARPAGARGRFIEKAYITRTMGAALKLAV